MNKGEDRLDSNHVKRATEITTGGNGQRPSAFPAGHHGNRLQRRHQQERQEQLEEHEQQQQPPLPQNTSSSDEPAPTSFPVSEKRVSSAYKTPSPDLSAYATSSVANRIHMFSSKGAHDKGNGNQPVHLATRSPKTKAKTLTLSQPTSTESEPTLSGHSKGINEKPTRSSPTRRKEDQGPRSDQAKSKNRGEGEHKEDRSGSLSGGDSPKGRERKAKRENLPMIGDKNIAYAPLLSRVSGNNDSEGALKGDERRREENSNNGISFVQKRNDGFPEGRAIVESDCGEKRHDLFRQKESYRKVTDGKGSRLDDCTEICSPPLPASLSRDSGISSPSVDEAKAIDQREEKPKDNRGQSKALKLERRNNGGTRDEDRDTSNTGFPHSGKGEKEEDGGKMVPKANNIATSMRLSLDSSQTGDPTVCSQSHLSSNLPSATLPEAESISSQGESNPVVTPLDHIGGQTDKAMVTAAGIDSMDTHARTESGPAFFDSREDRAATTANSTSVDLSTTLHPGRLAEHEASTCTVGEASGGLDSDGVVLDGLNTSISESNLVTGDQVTLQDYNSTSVVVNYQKDLSTGLTLNSTNLELEDSSRHSQSTKETTVATANALTNAIETSSPNNTQTTETTTATTSDLSLSSSSTWPSSSLVTAENNSENPTASDNSNKLLHQESQTSGQCSVSESDIERERIQENEEEPKHQQLPQEHKEQLSNLDSGTFLCQPEEDNEKARTSGCENGDCRLKQVSVDVETRLLSAEGVITVDTDIKTPTKNTPKPANQVDNGDSIVPIDNNTTEALPPFKPKRGKLTFKDISIQEVISLQTDSPGQKLKGILKSKSSESVDVGTSICVCGGAKEKLQSARSVSFKKTHTKNTFSYYNAAFEGEIREEPSRRPSLADVVSHIMRTNSVVDVEEEEDNSHPYGRDNSLTDLINGKRRETFNMDAGKMIVWFALAIMIVSLAGVIIFMSESYNLTHKEEVLYFPPDDTTLAHHSR